MSQNVFCGWEHFVLVDGRLLGFLRFLDARLGRVLRAAEDRQFFVLTLLRRRGTRVEPSLVDLLRDDAFVLSVRCVDVVYDVVVVEEVFGDLNLLVVDHDHDVLAWLGCLVELLVHDLHVLACVLGQGTVPVVDHWSGM